MDADEVPRPTHTNVDATDVSFLMQDQERTRSEVSLSNTRTYPTAEDSFTDYFNAFASRESTRGVHCPS
jgi:hypothetical protein